MNGKDGGVVSTIEFIGRGAIYAGATCHECGSGSLDHFSTCSFKRKYNLTETRNAMRRAIACSARTYPDERDQKTWEFFVQELLRTGDLSQSYVEFILDPKWKL